MSLRLSSSGFCSPAKTPECESKDKKVILFRNENGDALLVPVEEFLRAIQELSKKHCQNSDTFTSSCKSTSSLPSASISRPDTALSSHSHFVDSIKNGFNRFVDGGKKFFNNIKDWFVSQNRSSSNPNEDVFGNGNCGLASLLMLGKMFGKIDGNPEDVNSQIEALRKISGASLNEFDGSTLQELANGAKKIGLNADVQRLSVDALSSGLRNGQKFIVAVNPASLYPGHAKDGQHAIVVLDVNRQNGTALIADPSDTSGPKEVPLSNLSLAMSDMGNQVLSVSDTNNKVLAA